MKANVLLLGPVGSGKSYSLRTLLPHWPDERGTAHTGVGKEVMLLALEPGADATLGHFSCEMGLHVHQHLPATIGWEEMEEWVDRLGKLSMEDVAKMTVPITVRQHYQHFLQLYSICAHFKCDRCGEDFGPVDSWGEDRVFAVDGLSGLSDMASQYLIGPKPIRSLPQTGAAQELIKAFLQKCVSIPASFALIAHWSREVNETTGSTSITVDTIGQKLAPKLLKLFDEIAVSRRDGTKFSWSTLEDRIELKARRLPYKDNLEPDFGLIFGTKAA